MKKFAWEHRMRYLTSAEVVPLLAVNNDLATEPEAAYGETPKEYHSIPNTLYSPKLALVPEELAEFVRSTQPREWKKLVERTGGDDKAMKRLAERVSKEIDNGGTIKILRQEKVNVGEGLT